MRAIRGTHLATGAAICGLLIAACGDPDHAAGDAAAVPDRRPKPVPLAGQRPIVAIEGGVLVDPSSAPVIAGEGALAVGVIGDSITQGGRAGAWFPRSLQRLLQSVDPRAVVEAHAVAGETCADLAERFPAQIIERRPAYGAVIIQCGLNDLHNGAHQAKIRRSIDQMIDGATRAGMRVVLLTAGPIWGHPGWTEEKEIAKAAHNEWVLGRAGVVAVDIESALAEGSPPRLRAGFVNVDHLHPNREGLDEIARVVFQAAFASGWRNVGPFIRVREDT